MNIGGLGGAASLPMLVSLTLPGQSPAPAGVAGPAASGSPSDQPLPGSRAVGSKAEFKAELKAEVATEAKAKAEAAKPPPLPPLKVLTVAEFRVMLGIPGLPMQPGGSGSTPGSHPGAAAPAAAYGSYT
jgi:hypothetical protein